MEHFVEQVALTVGLVIEMIAIGVIAIGVLQTLMRMPAVILRENNHSGGIDLWLSFARWLVAALTFQLAADIVHTTVAPSWTEIGRVAAIAVIRTLLTFALDYDLGEMRARKSRRPEPLSAAESVSS